MRRYLKILLTSFLVLGLVIVSIGVYCLIYSSGMSESKESHRASLILGKLARDQGFDSASMPTFNRQVPNDPSDALAKWPKVTCNIQGSLRVPPDSKSFEFGLDNWDVANDPPAVNVSIMCEGVERSIQENFETSWFESWNESKNPDPGIDLVVCGRRIGSMPLGAQVLNINFTPKPSAHSKFTIITQMATLTTSPQATIRASIEHFDLTFLTEHGWTQEDANNLRKQASVIVRGISDEQALLSGLEVTAKEIELSNDVNAFALAAKRFILNEPTNEGENPTVWHINGDNIYTFPHAPRKSGVKFFDVYAFKNSGAEDWHLLLQVTENATASFDPYLFLWRVLHE